MSDPHHKAMPARGPGRPRQEIPLTSLTTWIPPVLHDRLMQIAQQRDQSVSSLVRQVLILKLSD